MKIILSLVFVFLLAIVAIAAPIVSGPTVIEPGVTGTLTISDPVNNVVTRTFEFTNTNKDVTGVLAFGAVVVFTTDPTVSVAFPANMQFTVYGARDYTVSYSIPANCTFVPASLQINGIIQPNPVITDGKFAVPITIPANTGTTDGKVIVVDKITLPLAQ